MQADSVPLLSSNLLAAVASGQAAWQTSVREADWAETMSTVRELQREGVPELIQLTEPLAAAAAGLAGQQVPALEPDTVESWYCERAAYLDISCRAVASAAALLQEGLARGAAPNGPVARLAKVRAAERTAPAMNELVQGTDMAAGAAGCSSPGRAFSIHGRLPRPGL